MAGQLQSKAGTSVIAGSAGGESCEADAQLSRNPQPSCPPDHAGGIPLHDAITLAQAIQGSDDALCALLRFLDADLKAHVAALIGTRQRGIIEVEDVVQVTYLEAFLRIRRLHLNSEGAFRAWLWQVAENNVKDALKKMDAARRPPPDKRIATEDSDDSYVDLLNQMGGTLTTPSKLMAREEARRIMNAAIDRLPSDYATVVKLCDLRGYSSAQAAEVLQRSEAAIRMLRARAHDRLADILGANLDL